MRHTFAFCFLVYCAVLLVAHPQTASAARVLGIDVSTYQSSVNWGSVAGDGRVFSYTRASYGSGTYVDPTFAANMQNGTAAGVLMGAYHFAYPQYNSPTAEAAHFLAAGGSYIGPGYLRPVLDVEQAGGTTPVGASSLSAWVNAFISYVTTNSPYGTAAEPLIYCNTNYASNYLNSSVTSHSLWIANWNYSDAYAQSTANNPGTGVWGSNGKTWSFWQYSDNGSVGGESPVDKDVANGDVNFVRSFLINGTPAPNTLQRFDVNGTAAASGVTNGGSYTWESAKYSSTSAGTDPAPWNDGNFLRLAAGTDAAASNYTITANSNHTFAGIFLQTGGGGTVTINGPGVLSIAAGDQGMFVATSTQTLTINASLSGSGKLVWQGSGSASVNGGSLYLLGHNTYTGGTALNCTAGLNFNNNDSFGTGRITWGYTGSTIVQFVLSDDIATAPIILNNAMTTLAGGQLIYVGPAVAPVTFTGDWTLASGSSRLTVGNASHASTKMTISGSIDGGGGALVKDGVGTLILSGENSYNGGTTLNAGTLLVNNTEGSGTGTGSVAVAAGSVLGGAGTIQGAVTNSGTVRPGDSVGTLHLSSTYSQASGGKLEIDLASLASHDELAVTGAATLAGTLAVLVGSFAPHEGDLYEIMTASGFGGTTFATTSLPALTGNLVWKMNYGATAVTLSVLLPGDFDSDGTVDAGDYLVWLTNVGQPAGTLLNDTAGSTIGNDQYNLWRSNFGKISGTGSGSGASFGQAVPEPSVVILALVGCAGMTMLRGRRRKVS